HGARAAADEEDSARPTAPRPAAPAPVADDKVRGLESRLDEALTEIASLRTAAADLKAQVAALAEQLRGLKEAVGAECRAPALHFAVRPGISAGLAGDRPRLARGGPP